MKELIINFVKQIPGGDWLLLKYVNVKRTLKFSRMGGAKEVFTFHFNNNGWGSNESVSGHGSTMQYTENIRTEIPKLFQSLGIETLLDAPCGDFNWFKEIQEKSKYNYIGGDIVLPLIEQNQKLYGNQHTQFVEMDIIKERLPKADLWLCRDCLFHFSYDDIFSTLHNFIQSDIPWILTSTHNECARNRNITTGDFRLINLELPPFSFGKPEFMIKDWIEGYPVRNLALWRKDELLKALRSNSEYLKRFGTNN